MLAELTSSQIADWAEFLRLEPIGWWEEWRRFGMLAALIANVNRGKHQRAFSDEDFMPPEIRMKEPAPKQSVEEQKAIMKAILAPFRRRKAEQDAAKRRKGA